MGGSMIKEFEWFYVVLEIVLSKICICRWFDILLYFNVVKIVYKYLINNCLL